MKLIPTFKCTDFDKSVLFYTAVLGFEVAFRYSTNTQFHFAGLIKDGCELHLSNHGGDGVFGSVAYVRVENVDELFEAFCKRGLSPSHRIQSPVHQGPVDQTWGMREFYVDDPDGNTLRFGSPL
jgi:catechol 2,3-dioxygenase-like lactoylglutathione lyase family enzyme